MRQVHAAVVVLIILAVLAIGLEGVGAPGTLSVASGGQAAGPLAAEALAADVQLATAEPGTQTGTGTETGAVEDPAAATVDGSKRCSHPAGITIAYPSQWTASDGPDDLRCARFGPGDLGPHVEGERRAPVLAVVHPIDFDTAVAGDPGLGQAVADTVIDGRRAVRISGTDDAGIAFARYLIDLSAGTGEPHTLAIDTAGVEGVDHEIGRRALDLMARSINVTAGQNQVAPTTVGRYGAAGHDDSFVVLAEQRDDVVCFRLEQQVTESCIGQGTAPSTIVLDQDGRAVITGLVPSDTFQVDLVAADGTVRSVLPAPVLAGAGAAGAEVAAFAALEIARTTTVVLYDLDGHEL